MKKITIAIDGPAAAGKSTIAQEVARRLNFTYIDTGAMYRAVTLYCLNKNINCQDENKVNSVLQNINIELKPHHVIYLNGENVSYNIRTREVNANVSYIASYKNVRLFLVEQQRKMAKNESVVMDGRDIGSYVLPQADVKIFQVANIETRAKRRYEENLENDIECTYEGILEELRKRDYIDSNRDFAPLKKSPDAIELNTSNLSIDEVVNKVLEIVKMKVGNLNE